MIDADRPNILVAFKMSRWEHYLEAASGAGADEEAVAREAPESVSELRRSHGIHRSGLERVLEHLDARGHDYTAAYRGDVDETADYDLIVTVGGDGTVLDLSHKVRDVPILAINSHPESSVGYFCAGIADEFPALLDSALDAELDAHDLLRFRIRIDDQRVGPPVLNDILVSHSNPAAVSRYVLETGDGVAENQRSSGIWVATPAGSTAAIRSAGGSILPLGCNCIEYLVREPYPVPDEPYRHQKGIQPVGQTLRIQSRMQSGAVFVDGPHISRELEFDQVVSVDADAPTLTLFGLDVSRRTSDK